VTDKDLPVESWSAAWVFVKFRKPGGDGYSHATLSRDRTHHTVPGVAALDVGLTDGKGVDVALELVGLPLTMQQAVRSLAVFGRAVLVGITDKPLKINSYTEVLGREAEIIGSSDHLMAELPLLFEFARRGALDLRSIVTHTVPLDADPINRALDALDEFAGDARTVIVPQYP